MDNKTREETKLAVFTNHVIVEKIFQFLSARDLSSCARTCSLWYKISVAEKKRRLDISWMFTVGPYPENRFELEHMKSSVIMEQCEVERRTFDQMKNLRIQPAFCTAFMSSPLFGNIHEFFPCFGSDKPRIKRIKPSESVFTRKYLNSVMDNVLKSFLPEHCKMTFTVSNGIIGYKKDGMPMEVETKPAVAAMFIPEIPGVQVKHYAITGKNSCLSEFVSENAPVKCVLLFLTSRGQSIAKKLVHSCCPEEGQFNIAVGGAIVEHTESLLGSATAFCGSNVEAASVILNAGDKAEEITAKFEIFRETGLLEHKCIAYMFACVARGYLYHLDHNVESTIFSKMYPKVPVIGVYGEGIMWKKLSCSFSELNLDITLAAGQSFRWNKTNNGEWFGVISDWVFSLKQDTKGNLLYKVLNSLKSDEILEKNDSALERPRKKLKAVKKTKMEYHSFSSTNHEKILNDYFNLNFNLEQHYALWSEVDENFKSVGKIHKGIRILRQDPVENLFSFICSANNNIPRITSMVGKLCSNYGEKLLQLDDQTFYTFPTIHHLAADDVESKLRTLGFGYRAKYINQTAKALLQEKPSGWLENLRNVSYKEAHQELLTLHGVGAKVADCICLMSLDKYDAIPVDTHIWQVTLKDYMPHLRNSKTLTHKIYQEIGDFYRERFGKYAGWANTVLFANDLKMFKSNKE